AAPRIEAQRQVERPAAAAPAQAPAASGAPPVAVQAIRAAIDAQATAAVAAALAPKVATEDLTIKPIQQKPSLFIEPITQEAPPEQPVPSSFIPPQPERPLARSPRMPRVDELPLPAQNQLRARERAQQPQEDPL